MGGVGRHMYWASVRGSGGTFYRRDFRRRPPRSVQGIFLAEPPDFLQPVGRSSGVSSTLGEREVLATDVEHVGLYLLGRFYNLEWFSHMDTKTIKQC